MEGHYRSGEFNKTITFINSFWTFIKDMARPWKAFFENYVLRIKNDSRQVVHRLTFTDYLLGGVSLFILFLAGLTILAGMGIVSYQSFMWLKDGIWKELPLFASFNYLLDGTALHGWVSDPQSWLGLHNMVVWCLENIPLSLILIVDGMAVMFIVFAVVTMGLSFKYYQIKGK